LIPRNSGGSAIYTAVIEKFGDLLVKETLFGAAGRAGAGAKHPLALKNLLGAKIKLVPGYKGTASIKLAMQRGEIAGLCAIGMSTVTSYWRDEYKSGAFRPIIQTGGGKHPLLAGLPHVSDYAKSEADRQVFRLIFGTHELGRLYLAPPAVPIARRDALRTAFTRTVKDPAFLADAAKTRIDVSPMTGMEVESFMTRVLTSPTAVVERAKQAMSAK
jgi:tripartite-type tricarboxylate transporter receptor subunit TctC